MFSSDRVVTEPILSWASRVSLVSPRGAVSFRESRVGSFEHLSAYEESKRVGLLPLRRHGANTGVLRAGRIASRPCVWRSPAPTARRDGRLDRPALKSRRLRTMIPSLAAPPAGGRRRSGRRAGAAGVPWKAQRKFRRAELKPDIEAKHSISGARWPPRNAQASWCRCIRRGWSRAF